MFFPTAAIDSELPLNLIPLAICVIPIVASFFILAIGNRSEKWRDLFVLFITALTLFLALILFRSCAAGTVTLSLRAGFMEPLFYFQVDRLGAAMTLLASLIWFLATLYALTYMSHEHKRNRFYLFYLISLGSCLGVFLSGDFLTLFIFFEIMTFASYMLVIHAENREAMDAGNSYLFLGVGGGLALLAGIMLLRFFGGSLAIGPQLETLQALGWLHFLIGALMIAGFGVKAGMVPVHIWLPKAHPVAPSPASALLSGLMIKTGAYGIIRVLNMLFTPAEPEGASWATTIDLGLFILWTGIATMFIAAFIALFQTNAKRILAYSSVSQMGYILMGLGAAAYLGFEGAMGLSGAFYHIINHAFFKASLFMLIGAVYMRTHELDLNRLGGLMSSFPFATAACFIAAGGITGVPGLNGYTSKTLLHHAIEDTFHHSGQYSLFLAERIFTVTSIFTVIYITKLCYGVFLGPRPAHLTGLKGETAGEKIVFGVMSVCILILGLFPSFIMKNFILPLSASFTIDPYKVNYLAKLNFWDRHDLQAILTVLTAGLLLFFLFGKVLNILNRVKLPAIGIESLLYRSVIRAGAFLFTGAGRLIDTGTDKVVINSPQILRGYSRIGGLIETVVDKIYINSPNLVRHYARTGRLVDNLAETMLVGTLHPLKEICCKIARLDTNGLVWTGQGISRSAAAVGDFVYSLWFKTIRTVMYRLWSVLRQGFVFLMRVDFNPRGDRFYQYLNISNLDLNLLLMVGFLLLLLSIYFITS